MTTDETIQPCQVCKHSLADHEGVPGAPCTATDCECGMWIRSTDASQPTTVKTAAAGAREPRTEVPVERGTFDDYANRILDVLFENRGSYEHGDPGEVLYNLADDAHVPYKAASVTMLRLEQMGWVRVTRQYGDEARRANIIIRIDVV